MNCDSNLDVAVYSNVRHSYHYIPFNVSVLSPDFRDIRTELKRLGYTTRDIAHDYGYSTRQINRFLEGKLPADDPTTRQMAVFFKTIGLGL